MGAQILLLDTQFPRGQGTAPFLSPGGSLPPPFSASDTPSLSAAC